MLVLTTPTLLIMLDITVIHMSHVAIILLENVCRNSLINDGHNFSSLSFFHNANQQLLQPIGTHVFRFGVVLGSPGGATVAALLGYYTFTGESAILLPAGAIVSLRLSEPRNRLVTSLLVFIYSSMFGTYY
jgi:hypothetical protein